MTAVAQGPAHIDSPELLKAFRARLVDFQQLCRRALDGNAALVRETADWVKNEQKAHWQLQLRKRQEALNVAESNYKQAQWYASTKGRMSGVEEKRLLNKALRAKEEAEEKLAAVKKWSLSFDQRVDKLMSPCHSLTNLVDELTPRALSRLDGMLDALDEYFRSPS